MSGPDDEEDEDKAELASEETSEPADETSSEPDEVFEDEIDDDDADEFADDDEFDESDEDLKVVDEVLTHKDQNARALAIRRAIEERLEAKRLSKDLDYLDLDLDSDD